MAKKNEDYTYSKNVEDSYVTLDIAVSKDRFLKEKERVLKKNAGRVKIPGFRPGKAPKAMMEGAMGNQLITDTLEELLPSVTLEVMQKESLEPITRVEYEVKEDSDKVSFGASFATFPEFSLKPLETISVQKQEPIVTKKDLESALDRLFQESKKEETEPTDAWAKTVHEKVKDLNDLKKLLKKQLEQEKQRTTEQEYQEKIVTAAIEKTKIPVPQKLITIEAERREKEYRKQIENLGLTVEDFLRNQKQTIEDMKKLWEEEAKKKIQTDILFAKIAKEYSLSATEEDVQKEIGLLTDEKLKSTYSTEQGQEYIRNVLVQQKSLKKLLSLVE